MDQVRTVGPLHLGKGSILIRVTMELLNDKYMKTWSYRCEVHTIKNIISVLWGEMFEKIHCSEYIGIFRSLSFYDPENVSFKNEDGLFLD